jgi:MoaA/NifB/PqqE/SkfB family radical SAM enzyme
MAARIRRRGGVFLAELEQRIVDEFRAHRDGADLEYVCNAPFSNMYFRIDGKVGPCWLAFHGAPSWPEQSIAEIWFGPYFEGIRENIRQRDLSKHGGCAVCEKNLRTGNYVAALAFAYDTPTPLKRYPKIMEFELSNKCNLECTMCRGELSSSIRKNRDKLPPLPIVYDGRFVEELVEFIPHLEDMRFNGGEPLLPDISYQIWDKVARINPAIEITIATNGTVFNRRVQEILERCNFRINVSIDALDKGNFERIRKNARYDIVMRNVTYFGEYCRRKGSKFCIMANPMRQNWWEMPALVEWANGRGYHIAFNTIVKPEFSSLINWNADDLQRVYDDLRGHRFGAVERTEIPSVSEANIRRYENLVENQIHSWLVARQQAVPFFSKSYTGYAS